jgi:hypothetical protein
VRLVTDIVWLGTLLFDQPNLSAAAAFYQILVAGIVVLCIHPALRVGNRRIAFLNGAVLGRFHRMGRVFPRAWARLNVGVRCCRATSMLQRHTSATPLADHKPAGPIACHLRYLPETKHSRLRW